MPDGAQTVAFAGASLRRQGAPKNLLLRAFGIPFPCCVMVFLKGGTVLKTRITELFGIRYPILLSGMSWISVPEMVAAVSNAGGIGILATGPLDPEQTREAIREIRRPRRSIGD